jgi:iron complex outermembrane recepter protein
MLAPVTASLLAFTVPALPAPAGHDGYAFPIDLRGGALDMALHDLARQTGAELLFDRAATRGLRARRVKGRLTVDAALRALLDGTGLAARRTASGAWVVERASLPAAAPAEELAEPEILVVGRKTQNLDIRRRETDIQPYQVSTRAQIVEAHRDDLEQYFRSRASGNAQVYPARYLQNGQTNSQIDLRGLGTDQTLILVDGRRLPGIPVAPLAFQQPDINAIPLHAIERVETLTGTAGGIYGFGALGGVVNVILRRDLNGVELHGTAGISTRGDARRLNLEGGFGFSPDQGDTHVMVYLSQSWEEALLEGERDYALSARQFVEGRLPKQFSGTGTPLGSNAINVFEYSGKSLVFKPAYGGATLASDRTTLPRGFSGGIGDLVAALTRNAGKTDLTLSNERNASDLGSTPGTSSALFGLRHRFAGGIEAYFDALLLRNHGRYDGLTSDGELVLTPKSALNPFDNYVSITFPGPAAPQAIRTSYSSDRYTAGLILPLPHRWKATAEATFGSVRFRMTGGTQGYLTYVGLDDDPGFNPLGDWDALQRDLAAYRRSTSADREAHNRYRDQSLRLAGPLWRSEAGTATLSLLAQNRVEKVPAYRAQVIAEIYEFAPIYTDYAGRTSSTRSLSAELDAPLTAADAPVPLLKGLAVQLAARHDDQLFRFSIDPTEPGATRRRTRFAGTAFTAGAKFLPLPWLMLRGSFATGLQPPPLDDLIQYDLPSSLSVLSDPKRGNAWFTDSGNYVIHLSGTPDLKAIRASTLALGMVFNPDGEGAPRISFDYSHIRRTHDPVTLDAATILAHEDAWPERVTRLPLTDADRARGYSAGAITAIDARVMNAGTLDVESVDARLDWTLPFAGGTLRAYGTGTWQIRSVLRAPFDLPDEMVGYHNGPLRWRGNGGADWTIGRTRIGANLQYFSRYQVAQSESYLCCSSIAEALQGSRYVKAQTYLDLHASRRFRLRWAERESEFSLDLGIVNLFDQKPPYDALSTFTGSLPLYSPYGDPRRRRIELSLNARF